MTTVFVHRYQPFATVGSVVLHVPVGLVVPLVHAWYVMDVDFTVTDVPFVPFFPANDTAIENFLFTVISSTTTGIVASQFVVIVEVVVNVILTFDVPLFSTDTLNPDGQTISFLFTVTLAH